MSWKKSWLVLILLKVFAFETVHGQGDPCTTLRGSPGICVPILTCRTITQLFSNSPRPLPTSVSDQVRKSHCGTFNNTHHVCCEQTHITWGTAHSEPITTAEGGSCITLKKDTGICVPILTCQTIIQLFDSSPRPLPPEVTDQVRQSHCGTFNNTHHVCCDRDKVTVPPQVSTTPDSIIRPGIQKSEDELETVLATLRQTACGWNDMASFEEQFDDDTNRITCLSNGLYAEISEFPWMALLVYFDGVSRTLDCGGSLIHERYVLTAAHCIRVQNKRLVSVHLGEHDTEATKDCTIECRITERCAPPMQKIDVEEAIYHQDYNPRTFSDDIGILRLKSNAVIATNVKPICLPVTSASRHFFTDSMIVTGWGRIENGNKATILQKAWVPVRSIDYCQQAHRFVRMTAKHFCAGGEKLIDTCKGDSGGPLAGFGPYTDNINRYIQYGVVSAGSMFCGARNSPGIYARVESYVFWIASNLNLSVDTSPEMVID